MNTDGYKTRQRALIVSYLQSNPDRHITADELAAHLKDKNSPVGKSTIYRQLNRLLEAKLVRRYFIEGAKSACYQYCGDMSGCEHHFHLKCMSCGELIHLDCRLLEQMDAHIEQEHHFKIDQTRTVLYGLCAACTQQKGEQQ